MAIESVNSVMTAQVAKQATTGVKPATEYTDVSLADKAPKVDNTTRVVEKSEGKDGNYSSGNGEASREMLQKAVEDLNKKMTNSEVQYGFHDATNRVTIKIIDKDTKEVIKELPPEKTLDLIAKAWELAGIMVDERR